MAESDIKEVIDAMVELMTDNTVPRNIKTKMEGIIKSLQEKEDKSLRINKALSVLEEVSDDNNIQPYTRTQLWNIVSMLESLNA
jgi:uncharacterized protein (UPF0147 family)